MVLLLGILFLVFTGLPLTVLALRGIHPERTPAGWHDAWHDGERRHGAVAAGWPQSNHDHAYRMAPEGQQTRLTAEDSEVVLAWDEPRPGDHCSAYGTREYTARLLDIPNSQEGTRACQMSKMEIRGIVYDKPSRCEYRGSTGEVFGHWEVTNEMGCLPSWRAFSKEGCTNEGTGSHQRRVKARLQGVQKGDDWMKMCTTTPAKIDGLHFSKPSYCEKGILGVYGVWGIEDTKC
ncbi:hypothetical protein BDN72DRAFT_837148 [Pluteus cervinus]|uniref:Uncharacterized protein n=1 Tax=Pluteus cervinus TaxID=181527 RepID=A0ACD3B169_9AGAR|nr:hypothetical protein BDN72DRAFT_837148 [Pluteus cervinus]